MNVVRTIHDRVLPIALFRVASSAPNSLNRRYQLTGLVLCRLVLSFHDCAMGSEAGFVELDWHSKSYDRRGQH